MIFFKQLLKSAKYTGAIVPSSSFLADKMVGLADVELAKTILELGPGSGAITKAIIRAKPVDCRLVTIDINHEFVEHLKKTYPAVEHIEADIIYLKEKITALGIQSVDVIFSGIPFVDFTSAECAVMLDQIGLVMSEKSRLVLFTYSRIKFKTFFQSFEKVALSYVPLNIPPAYILVLKKKLKK